MSKLIKNSFLYTLVLLLQNAASFFLLPLYTSFLTPEDYGIVAVVTSIMSVLTILFTLSLNGAGNRFYFAYKEHESKLRKFWGSLFWFTVLNSFVLGTVFYLFRAILLEPFASGIPFHPYLLLGLVSVMLNPAFLFFQSCIQATQNGKQFALQNFFFFLFNLLLTIAFVTVVKIGAMGVLLARAITNIVFFIITLILFIPKIAIKIDKNDIKTGLRYSLPLIPHSLFGWTYSTIDRLLINKIRSTSEVGLYNIGAQFGLVMSIITDSINKAYAPWFFEKLESGDAGKEQIVSVSSFLVVFYSFLALGLSLFSPELVVIMTKDSFHGSWITIPFITFSYVFGGIYYVVCNSLFVKKTYLVPFVTLSSAVFSVVLNLVLIPKLGMIGAALSGLASQFVTSAIVLFVSMRVEPILYKWLKMYISVFSFLLLSLVTFLFKPWVVHGMVLKTIVVLVSFSMMYLMSKNEIYLIIDYAKKIMNRNQKN